MPLPVFTFHVTGGLLRLIHLLIIKGQRKTQPGSINKRTVRGIVAPSGSTLEMPANTKNTANNKPMPIYADISVTSKEAVSILTRAAQSPTLGEWPA